MCTTWKTSNPLPIGWFLASLIKIQKCIVKKQMKVFSYIHIHWGPPSLLPLRGPMGSPWELSRTTFILHQRRYSIYTQYNLHISTSGSGDWRRCWNLHSCGNWGPPLGPPWGHMYNFNNFESCTITDPAPFGLCNIYAHAFWKKYYFPLPPLNKLLFFHPPPPLP